MPLDTSSSIDVWKWVEVVLVLALGLVVNRLAGAINATRKEIELNTAGIAATQATLEALDDKHDDPDSVCSTVKLHESQADMVKTQKAHVRFMRYQRRVYTALLQKDGHDAPAIVLIEEDDGGN